MNNGSNPFIGPRPIRRGQHIHGRQREVRDLFHLLVAERIVWLYSPSGAGKTSLVEAGLVPLLESEGFRVSPPIRVSWQTPAGAADNRYVTSTLASLEDGHGGTAPAELAETTLTEYMARRQEADANTVLVFDQFEEMVTADPLDVQAKQAFFSQLGRALWDPNLWTLFVLREDYLAALDPYVDPIPTRLGNTFRLELLGREAAGEAITETAREGGREFPAADRLVRDLARVKVQQPDGSFVEQTGNHVEPVQLQVVCRRLWDAMPADAESVDPRHLERFGDVIEALAHYYADSVARIAAGDVARERAIREWFGDGLIRPAGVRAQVLRGRAQSEGLANEVIEELRDAHLIRADRRAGATWYELAHDRLVDPVLRDNAAWRRRHLSDLQRRAALWERQGHPPGLLLADGELAAGEVWAERNGPLVSELERRFLAASRRAQAAAERERRQTLWIRRLAIVATIVGALALAASAVAGWKWWEAEEQACKARERERTAIAGKLLAGGRTTWGNLVALEVRRPDVTPAAVEVLHQALNAAHDVPIALEGHDDELRSASFSPDGSRLVTASADGTARIWDAVTGEPVAVLPDRGEAVVVAASYSADGRQVVTTSQDGTIRRWDADSQTLLSTLAGQPVSEVAAEFYSADGARVVSTSADGTARLLDTATGNLLATFEGHQLPVAAASFSPDGSRLATASDDQTARIWDAATGELLATLRGHEEPVVAVSFSADGWRLVTASWDHTARIWEVAMDESLATLRGHADDVLAAAFNVDGSRLATASADGTSRIWDGATGELLHTLRGHGNRVVAVAFSGGGARLATASMDTTARLWDYATGKQVAVLRGHRAGVVSAAFSADGSRLATASWDGTAGIWAAATGELLTTLKGHQGEVVAASFSADGSRLLTASWDRTARLWDAVTGAPAAIFESHTGEVDVASFSPDGSRLVTASDDGTLRFREAATGRPLATFEGHTSPVTAASFSADGARLLTASEDHTARLWEAATGRLLATLAGHSGTVTAVSFSPDGRRLMSASRDGTARLWDATTGAALATLQGHTGGIYAASFSPDGSRLVTAAADRTARLWANVGDYTRYLRGRVRARTRLCLPALLRRQHLAEEAAEARRQEAACRACVPAFFERLGHAPSATGEAYLAAWGTYESCLATFR